ncbi:hypothetical protein I6F35_06665 [Bradyrhizobium sp. BRP22]|uniref:hypothetical protein n=1 Tax=Bradyrhizobium sp. BRP22 TaxID=2793821 RepID=UPI001CD3D058|nr:hypothetical protein [Bradyrhizobium sp. BRP22]MCA1452902.1 hypothetical protein [Bradyrhizobium sp. BRP22]
MKKLLAMSTLAGLLSLATIAEASAWTRYGTYYGPRGVSTVHVSGGCGYRYCSRTAVRTGPYGNTYVRQTTVSRW